MRIENSNLNKFFSEMAQNQERIMSRKRYHELEQDPLFLDPSSETGHRVLRVVAAMDKSLTVCY